MADRFFVPGPLAPGEFVLTGPEAHHLATVRRFADGDAVTLFNGDGREYPARVLSAAKKSVALAVGEPTAADRELPFPLVIASALPKGDRADFLIEKLTELGVTRFVPLVTARAVVQPKESTVEKFERAVVEASKQCGRNRLMAVEAPHTWPQLLARADLPAPRAVLHTGPGLSALGARGGAVAVGPEGGLTPDELELARAHGWALASLGPRVLRVETAALTAAALLGAGG